MKDHLDNGKEELKRNIMQVVDGFRFDQEWVSHQADDFPDHKGAGCGCGVCQKMKGINESTADSVLTFVDEYTQSKLKAFAGEVEEAIGEEKTPEGVKSAPKEPNDIFIILSPYFECKDCGELGCPYNPDVPAELAEAIDQYTKTMCERARQDELKQLWNSTQPDIVPEGAKANDMSEELHKRIEKLRSES